MTEDGRSLTLRRRFQKRSRTILLSGFATFCLLNLLVFRHAWRFTHFVEGGQKTAGPEALGTAQKLWIVVDGVRVPRPVVDRKPEDVGLVLKEERIGAVSTWTGRGSRALTVALFHGYGATKADLLDEAKEFSQHGASVVLVDFPGSGDSPGNTTTLGWTEAAVVQSVTDNIRQKHPSDALLLYGKSMGSAAILRAVSQYPIQADGLILENPFDRLLTTVGHRFESMGLPAFPGASLLVFWGSLQMGFNGFSHNPVEYAQTINIPTMLLTGEADPRVKVAEVQAIADALVGPSFMQVFPGAGHVGLLHADANMWNGVVGGFLEGTVR